MLTQECLQDAVKYGECFIKFGKTAEYIPELARVNKYHLGACIVGLDGTVMEYGDTRTPFTIQSISKLASLILAISDRGADYLFHDKVGVEPTGDPFNSIIKLETKTKPFNPFINAGAITVASCIDGKDSDEKFERFLQFIRKVCGNEEIALNEAVYLSENPLVTATALLPTTSKPPVFWKATSRNVWTFTSRCARSMSLRWTLPR